MKHLALLAATLESLAAGQIGVVESARTISALRHALGQDDNPLFFPFIGIDSETDRFPLGAVREHWAQEALERYDQERALSEAHFRSMALAAALPLLTWAQQSAA